MKGIAFIGMFLAMVIVLYLTIQNLKSKAPTSPQVMDAQDSTPTDLMNLPTEVKGKLNEAMERNEAERKAAEEVLER